MFTRCPQCKTVHPLNAALISHARGLVQCGACGRSFSALSFLFDEWPSGEAHRPAAGPGTTLPVLGTAEKSGTEADPVLSEDSEADKPGIDPGRLAWTLATALLVLLTIANIGWTFRGPLLDNPRISTWLKQTGFLQVEEQGLLKGLTVVV